MALTTELKKWEAKVFFPEEAFKEDTVADLSLLDKWLMIAKEDFVIISAETEACVYKIGRYFVEAGILSSCFTFQDGEYFDAYIDPGERNIQKVRESIDLLIKDIGKKVKGVWLVIPELEISWDKRTALYFIAKIQQLGCYGLLFYSDKENPDTLGKVLIEETYLKIYQFPKAVYNNKKNHKTLPPDKY